MIKVVIVDDHHVVRQGLKMYLGLDSRIEVVAEASNGLEALEVVLQHQPHVVVMDLMMPKRDGIEAIRDIKQAAPYTEIIALTSSLEEYRVHAAVQAGAVGYLLKDTSAETLLEAILAASRGEVRLHPEATKKLLREFFTERSTTELTPKETEVLVLLAKGLTNKHIADTLDMTEATCKSHVSNMLGKLNLSTRTQLALFAFKTNLLSTEDVGL